MRPSRRIGLLSTLLTSLALAASSSPAEAYVRTTLQSGRAVLWPSTCISVFVYTGNPPQMLRPNEFLTAARAAAASWSRSGVGCSDLAVSVMENPDAEAPVGHDGVNRVTFRRGEWCKEPRGEDEPCYDRSALAITSVFARRPKGVILDADIEVNAVNWSWADLTVRAGAGDTHDIQNTLTHELGHLIGLDHTCYSDRTNLPRPVDHRGRPIPNCDRAPDDVKATTMFVSVSRGDLERRSLSQDDVTAVCEMYPATEGEAVCRSTGIDDDGGCSYGGTGAARALPGLFVAGAAALTAALLRRRRRLRG